MKTNLRLSLLAVFTLFSCFAFAQANNLVVFSNDGYRFTLIVNGIRQNEKPETNVKVTGLTAPNYKVKVIFEDANYQPIDQQIQMMWGGEEIHGKELNCAIVSGKKGMKLRPESVADITTTPAANQVVYVFNPNASQTTTYSQTTTTTTTPVATTQPAAGTTVVTTTTGDPNAGGTATTGMTVSDGSGQSTTTTTTTTTTGNGASVGMNVGGVGMNVTITDNTGGMQTSQTTTTTTTSSSSSTTNSGTTTTVPATTTTSTACAWPMSATDFANAKASIEKQSFEDDKMKVAKQILNSNCMSTAQVKEIMGMFTFEDNKLAWAEYAYGKTTDPNNYYQLNDVFEFSSSVDKLNEYIESHKK